MAKKSVQLSGVVVAESAICSIDPDAGVLMYRGYDIAELAEHSTYEETALLLLDGELPSSEALAAFESELAERELAAETAEAVDRAAASAAPMDALRTAVSTLSGADAAQLIAQFPTIVARYHRRRLGLEPIAPDPSLSCAESFLAMLHGERPDERSARAFDVAAILHAEHELNASTFTARTVAGTGADLAAAVVAAIAALGGPLHGGANVAAMAMFERFGSPERAVDEVRAMLERKETLSGVGHPLYRAYDPRALILKRLAEELSQDAGEPDWYAIAEATERTAFEEKGLYPNVDLYSGPVYRYLGIPTELFTPLFAASRVVGWAAHVLEQQADNRIIRPSAAYVGAPRRPFPARERA
jgi:citrate synthase